MKFNLQPNTPVPLDHVVTGPVGDARWRDLPKSVRRINRMRAHDHIQSRRLTPQGRRRRGLG